MEYIFDLDGTLLDSQDGVLDSLQFSIEKHAPNYSHMIQQSLIGPPISVLLGQFMSDKGLIEVVSKEFRQHYDNIGYLKTKLFPDVRDGLEMLSERNKLFISTNKPWEPTKRILEMLKIFCFFDDIKTIDLKGCSNKSDMVRDILLENDIVDGVVIGDSQDDLESASNNQLDFIFCSYGYGSIKEGLGLKVVEQPKEIFKILQR